MLQVPTHTKKKNYTNTFKTFVYILYYYTSYIHPFRLSISFKTLVSLHRSNGSRCILYMLSNNISHFLFNLIFIFNLHTHVIFVITKTAQKKKYIMFFPILYQLQYSFNQSRACFVQCFYFFLNLKWLQRLQILKINIIYIPQN